MKKSDIFREPTLFRLAYSGSPLVKLHAHLEDRSGNVSNYFLWLNYKFDADGDHLWFSDDLGSESIKNLQCTPARFVNKEEKIIFPYRDSGSEFNRIVIQEMDNLDPSDFFIHIWNTLYETKLDYPGLLFYLTEWITTGVVRSKILFTTEWTKKL